jgi:murein endopeptidase
MRALIGMVAVLVLCGTAEARPHRKRTAEVSRVRGHRTKASRRHATAELPRIPRGVAGQSLGQPWHGALHAPARLPEGDGYHIRRPWRTYGTATTVGFVQRAIGEAREAFPDAHVLAVGDLSAKDGGAITEHHSHQSGRDVDVGLFYKQQPEHYPDSFVRATADNLDCAATWALLAAFVATADENGGAQVIFLDFAVQGLLYHWGQAHEVPDRLLERVFQFPHGRGASAGLVRHEPNHTDHLHVRFKCVAGDPGCR